MAENKPSRILDISSNAENNEQQYVEIGSNIYLGTKDGIRYSLIQSDNTFRLVEAPSDASINLSDSNESFETPQIYENFNLSDVKWSESLNQSTDMKVISVKCESSPCKGQGDEIGNTVLSPINFSPSFIKPDYEIVEKAKDEMTPEKVKNNPLLTYATLYPKQDKKQITYYVTPQRTYNNYPPVFPSPITLRPTRGIRKPRMPFMPHSSPFTPIPRARRGAPRMRRPRQQMYRYTPQILHSTPANISTVSYNSDTFTQSLSLSGSSSGNPSSSSLSRSDSSVEYPRVPNNTPTSLETVSPGNQKVFSLQWMPFIENYVALNSREAHNEKERRRRLRIKNACHAMRSSMPWLNEKADNARVFEEGVNYITYMRRMVGLDYDVEFMEQKTTY